jgi:hypothetical protein
MVEPDLDGMKAKIVRADETIVRLEAEIDAFLSREYRVIGEVDVNGRAYVFTAFGEPKLPPRFAVLAGEVIHHLRSCLDHLVTQLVTVEGGTPNHRHEFPLCRTPDAFEIARKRKKIAGVSANAAKRIREAQPYKADPKPGNSTLLLIHELDIIDKHRLVLVVVTTVLMATTLGMDNQIDIDVIGMTPPPRGIRPSKDGMEVFRVFFGDRFDEGIKIHNNFGFQIVFDSLGDEKNVPLTKALRHMRDAVVSVITGFFPTFSQPR